MAVARDKKNKRMKKEGDLVEQERNLAICQSDHNALRDVGIIQKYRIHFQFFYLARAMSGSGLLRRELTPHKLQWSLNASFIVFS